MSIYHFRLLTRRKLSAPKMLLRAFKSHFRSQKIRKTNERIVRGSRADRQANRQTEEQKEAQTERQTERESATVGLSTTPHTELRPRPTFMCTLRYA